TQAAIRGSTNLSAPDNTYRGDTTVARTIIRQIKDSIDLDRTLVVWIIDTSPSALRVTDELRRAAADFYDSGELKVVQTAQPEHLVSAVIGFGEESNFVLETPSADSAAVKNAFHELTTGNEGREVTFATLQQALDKYVPVLTQQRRRLIIVLATDE